MTKLVGHVDHFTPDRGLTGWIVDQDAPGEPVTATLMLGDDEAATVTARHARPDVVKAGYPTLVCGFSATVPARFFDGREHAVTFRAADGSSFTLNGLASILQERTVLGTATLGADGTTLSGWAIDPVSPTRQLFVDVFMDGRLVTSVPCRKDPKALKPTPNGQLPAGVFQAKLAPFVEPGLGFHEVSVSVSGFKSALNEVPLKIARGSMGEQVLADLEGGRISGWALNPTTRETLPVKVVCDGVVVAELPCHLFRGDLSKQFGAIEGGFDYELPLHLFDGVDHTVRLFGFGDLELRGSPRTLSYNQQLLHQVTGALRANNTTAGARGYGFLARDLSWLVQREGGADLPESSRKAAEALTVDLLHHAAFNQKAERAYDLIAQFLTGNALGYDEPAAATVLVNLVEALSREKRAALNVVLARPEHRARPFRPVIVAALMIADGSHDVGVSILFSICGRAKVSDAMVRFCVELLMRAGLTDEAKDLVFFSVVGK